MKNEKIGVYFSADDNVYDWTMAFLNSFREFNPHLRLILIPFSENIEKTIKLKDKYNFEIYEDKEGFEELEKIGEELKKIRNYKVTKFRRYASFWGPLDKFAYFDARQLILSNIKEYIDLLDKHKIDLLHYDTALNQVYNQGEFRTKMLKKGKARGFNSGRWIAKKGLFSLKDFVKYGKKCSKIRDQLNNRNADQAFFNYCCDMKDINYISLPGLKENLVRTTWARQPGKIYKKNNHYYIWDHGGLDHKKQLPWINWAGMKLSPVMPFFNLWNKYRNKNTNTIQKIFNNFKFFIRYPFYKIYSLIRKNRKTNLLYHSLRDKHKK